MKNCVILDDYQNVALQMADWDSLAGRVRITTLRAHLSEEDALVAALLEADIIVIMRERTPFPARLFARLPRLRLLVTSGMRNLAIDLAAAKAHGVAVCGTQSDSAPPVEMTWALICGLARQIVPENRALRGSGPWQHSVGVDLAGKRLGLIGLGKIGARVARIGAAFEMEVAAWSPNLTPERAAAGGAAYMSLEALLETADVLSIHLVLAAATRGLIGAAELARMKRTAILINTARAGIVDQQALISALEQGRIAGAGLDVFDHEPLPADHPFRILPNVLATPHLGYVTERNYRHYFAGAVQDIEAWLEGRLIRSLIA